MITNVNIRAGPKIFISEWLKCATGSLFYQYTNIHYSDIIMSAIAPQITVVSIFCSTVCSGTDQRKQPSSASLAFVRGIRQWPMDSTHKGPVSRKMFPLDDVIMFSSDCGIDAVIDIPFYVKYNYSIKLNVCSGLIKPPLKLAHGYVITYGCMWMKLLCN